MKKYDTTGWQISKSTPKTNQTRHNGSLADQDITSINFTQIKADELKKSNITLGRIIDLDESGQIDQY